MTGMSGTGVLQVDGALRQFVADELLDGLHVPLTLVLAGIDEKLNDVGYIIPGLGDAGDRLYGVV